VLSFRHLSKIWIEPLKGGNTMFDEKAVSTACGTADPTPAPACGAKDPTPAPACGAKDPTPAPACGAKDPEIK